MQYIEYLHSVKRVRQVLGTTYLCDLEGEFGAVLDHLTKMHISYRKYLREPTEVTSPHNAYSDGTRTKVVQFDKLFLERRRSYDDTEELCVVGERGMDAGEIAAAVASLEKDKQREIEQLRILRQKYPDA